MTRRTALTTLALAPFASAAVPAGDYLPRLEKNLRENILAFWYPRTLDRVNGGYIISAAAGGKLNPASSKGIVSQARNLWLFSRLARENRDSPSMLEAAAHGFAFLRDRLWDGKNGGFYWEVDAAGKQVIGPKKHMYGESFGLYAVSEYALAARNKQALDLANELFRLFEKHAYDPQYGGYRESFNQDWSTPPATEPGYMQATPDIKLMNTHLHLLESVTAYYRASESSVARERLTELISIESNSVVRKGLTACTDKYDRDWTPRLDAARKWNRVSYGHDLENVWLLIDACKALDFSPYPLLDLFRSLWAYSLKYGYDSERGGFWYSGNFNAPADERIKSWWVQAEVIVSALYMYKLTQDPSYWDVFAKTYDFIDKYQTDWKTGEWHETVTADLQQKGGKAHLWKAGYHNGRAMIECLNLLQMPGLGFGAPVGEVHPGGGA